MFKESLYAYVTSTKLSLVGPCIPWADPEGRGQGVQTPCKITSGYRFLRNTGMDPLEKQLDPLGPIVLEGGPYVKNVED